MNPVEFTCPYCNLDQSQEIYSTLNTDTPNAIPMILSNEVNLVTCISCGEQFQVLTPLLFNNVERKYAMYYSPDGFDEIDASNARIKSTLGEDHYLVNPQKFDDWELFKTVLAHLE